MLNVQSTVNGYNNRLLQKAYGISWDEGKSSLIEKNKLLDWTEYLPKLMFVIY
jgi:hypothetical protein